MKDICKGIDDLHKQLFLPIMIFTVIKANAIYTQKDEYEAIMNKESMNTIPI